MWLSLMVACTLIVHTTALFIKQLTFEHKLKPHRSIYMEFSPQ